MVGETLEFMATFASLLFSGDGWMVELIATFISVFIVVGSCVAVSTVNMRDLTPAGLVAIALAHGLGMVITVVSTANILGGYLNPAVTLGLLMSGQITVLQAVLHGMAQLLGASLATCLVKRTTKSAA